MAVAAAASGGATMAPSAMAAAIGSPYLTIDELAVARDRLLELA
jgi:hypothetical protein